jgi:hypothetical protein
MTGFRGVTNNREVERSNTMFQHILVPLDGSSSAVQAQSDGYDKSENRV